MLGRCRNFYYVKKIRLLDDILKLKSAEDVHARDYDMYWVMQLLSIS